ncbi:hypothetical protein DL767_003307 [Monosporascus sp. MG133]|nr:hypothetical protein DL767_003307 [Monosporascus sp. MG133]
MQLMSQLCGTAVTWLLFLLGAAGAAPTDIRTILSGADWSENTTIAYSGSAHFEHSTERWTIFDPPNYSAVLSPDEGLAIDLGGLDCVHVDTGAGTVTVGGGATFADIYEPVFAAGYEIQIGSCSCPGVVGVTLGGGVGRYQSLHGLIIDALVLVRLVTADGAIATASETLNPELFWGIRGAGANFGIVTSATYKLAPLINDGLSLTADFVFPTEMTEAFFHPQILTNWVYAGSETEGRRILGPLFELNPPFANATMIPWNRLVYTAGFGLNAAFCTGPAPRSIYTTTMRNLSADTYQAAFEKLSAFWEDVPAARGSAIELEMLGRPASGVIPDAKTAYPWQDAVAYAMFQMTWTDTSVAEQANTLARELRDDFAATSGYGGLAAYVSYAHGDEPIEAIYGEHKLQRLLALKDSWDPDNVFGFNHALPRWY